MGKVTDFLRKIGVLQVSKGDSVTGEFDNREDLKKKEETPQTEAAPEEEKKEESQPEESTEEPKTEE